MRTFLYPTTFNWTSPADHLLFDIGYSAALLFKAKELLRTIAECDDYPVAVGDLIEAIEAFEHGRLQMRNEIYDNAEEVARRGQEEPNKLQALQAEHQEMLLKHARDQNFALESLSEAVNEIQRLKAELRRLTEVAQ